MAAGMRLKDRTAVVTGAASGIGRAVAVSLARRGCHLALADVNRAGLADTAALVAPHGVRASQHLLDVANPEAVAALPEAVLAEHERADVLVNNAGVAVGGAFEEVSGADFEWLFAINFWGVVRMTRAFLPVLRASDEARIVNLSSVLGLIATPRQVAYCASKFAVRGFSEALRQELAGSTVGVTVVHPGGIATAISENARVPKGATPEEIAPRRAEMGKLLVMPPEKAGEIIVSGIERRFSRILVGSDAKLLSTIQRLAPVSYPAVLGWLMRRGR
jgi:NAD(P)-dependent dehydrogenase (short-subunit alcohol dehydrogenase family)